MSRDARKKQKHRLKRKQKQMQARKAASVMPLERIARSGGTLECYVNDDWTESGMASVQVLGQAADGRCAHCAFLIDVWCVGLKDAYGQRTVLRSDFEDLLDRMGEELDMVRITADQAKRLVAGGIRFARQNGFHLPPHADRWTAVFTDLGDVAAADLTGFGVGGEPGRIRYVGTKDFLRRRLASCSPEAFLARPDVEWVLADGTPGDERDEDGPLDTAGEFLGDDDDDDDDDDDSDVDVEASELLDALKDMVGGAGNQMEDAVRKWCFQTGQAPHPRLREALNTLLVSTLPLAAYSGAVEEVPELADDEDVEIPHPADLLEVGLDGMAPDDRRSIEEAMDQVNAFMGQFKSPMDMLAALEQNPGGAGPQLPPA